MVSTHNRIMNNKHIMQALRSLFMLQKCGNSDISTRQILSHPDFEKLCRQLKIQAPAIELNETIEALKIVSYVGVPSNSTIAQVLLQLIRHNINFLTLKQIIFLDFLLNQFKSSPLVEALKIALPIVFEINLKLKMDRDSMQHLSEYLYFASKNNLNDNAVEVIVNAMLDFSGDFDAQVAKSVIWSICDMNCSEFFEPILKKSTKSLVVHIDELTYNDMETTLSKLIFKYNKRYPFYYDEVFFDSCANYVIDNDLGFKHAIYVSRKLAKVDYNSTYLLDYMSKKIYENPELILNCDPLDIYSMAISLAMTDYRPIYWDHFKNLLSITGNVAESERKEIIWIKFGMSLCLLDIFKIDVLSKCLNENFLDQLFRKKSGPNIDNYITIWRSIKLYKPDLNCLLSSKYTPEILVQRFVSNVNHPLEIPLHKALGGDKYVKTGLFSKLGHHIDHVVIFRKGGYPVALNLSNSDIFIEDINLPPDNQLVVILALESFNYTINNKRMKSHAILSIKVLESKGYHVVPICLEVWEALADFEKIPYLMQSIKEKIGDSQIASQHIV